MAYAYYTGLVQFESLKKLDNYEKYSVCVALDEESLAKLKQNGFTGTIGEENTVFFNRPHQIETADGPVVFGPVACLEGESGAEVETDKVPGKGSTVTIKVQHYISKKGKNKGKTASKLDKVKILDYVEADWDDRPF